MACKFTNSQIHGDPLSSGLRGETVVITGASRGIGREIALIFARNRHPLFLLGRDSNALYSVVDECIGEGSPVVEAACCDLTDSDQIVQLEIPKTLTEPAVLINNAGFFLLKRLEQTSPEEFEQQWRLHVLAPFLLTKKWLAGMMRNEKGLIVNICSASSVEGRSQSGAYASSKHALLGWNRSLRQELTGSGIAVTAILPGQTFSDSWKGIKVDESELIHPGDLAKLVFTLSTLHPQSVVEEIRLMPERGNRAPN